MRYFIALVAVVMIGSTTTQGAIIANMDNPTAYSLTDVNQAGGIIVDDKLFDDFSWEVAKSINAAAPGGAEIVVTPIIMNGEIGLQFNGGWLAGPNEIADTTITFHVGVVDRPDLKRYDRRDGRMIIDNTLWMDAFAANDGGRVSISENVYSSDPRDGIADPVIDDPKFVYYFADHPSISQLVDHREYDQGYQDIWVVKDVLVSGLVDPASVAHLSRFYQTFSQSPEPASLALLGLGGLMVLKRRRSA